MIKTKFADLPAEKLFGEFYDLAVIGAGYAGFAAARKAASDGKKVILIDQRCDLLWESSRARNPLSGEWTEEFKPLGRAVSCATGIAADWIDPGSAEWVANELLLESGLRCLYYAVPVAVDMADGLLARVTFACAEGFRSIAARQWIDATENAAVARLCKASLPFPEAGGRVLRLFLQRLRWPDAIFGTLRVGQKGVKAAVERSWWSSEAVLRVDVADNCDYSNVSVMVNALSVFRRKAGKDFADAIVSHWSYVAYPVYNPRSRALSSPAKNLALAVPGYATSATETLCQRYMLGISALNSLSRRALCEDGASLIGKAPAQPVAVAEITSEILVAGLGTAGSFAAIAAGRTGADVLAIESSPFPGGVATSAGIHAYYFGCPGGMQEEIDDDVEELMPLFGPKGHLPGFHPLARRAVLEADMAECGVHTLYDSTLIGIEQNEGTVVSVTVAAPRGILRIRAGRYIDSTGEGTLCRLAGVPSQQGRSGDGCLHAFTQSWGAFGYFTDGLGSFISNLDCGFVNPEDSIDMTTARISSIHFLVEKSSVRSSNAFNRTTGVMPSIGLRQGRLIETDYRITLDDLVERRRFSDTIGYAGGHCDVHSVDFFAESKKLAFFNWGACAWTFLTCCEIPYRALLPIGLDNVWLACRAAGCDEEASNGLRMQRDMQRMGEAAGFAAAISLHDGGTSRDVPYEILAELLGNTGALAELDGKSCRFGCAINVFEGDELATGPADDDHIDRWIAALSNEAPGVILWRLYRVGPEKIADRLIPLLNSSNENEAWHAAVLLGAFGYSEAVTLLEEAIFNREVAQVGNRHKTPKYQTATWLLGECGSSKSAEALADIAADKSVGHITRITAIWSAANILFRLGDKACGDDMLAFDEILSTTADAADPLRPWERPLAAERLRKALGLDPGEADSALLANDPSQLARRAYDNLLQD